MPPSSWWSGFDEEFEVNLPGRGDTTFFVRVAGRELAATNGVAVVLHGVSGRHLRACPTCILLYQYGSIVDDTRQLISTTVERFPKLNLSYCRGRRFVSAEKDAMVESCLRRSRLVLAPSSL